MLLAVWAEVGEHMREHLQSFTLADMVDAGPGSRESPVPAVAGRGHPAPAVEPALSGPAPLVPAPDHRGLVLPAEHADVARLEDKRRPGHRRQIQPAGGQDPQQVSVGEAQRVARRRRGPGR